MPKDPPVSLSYFLNLWDLHTPPPSVHSLKMVGEYGCGVHFSCYQRLDWWNVLETELRNAVFAKVAQGTIRTVARQVRQPTIFVVIVDSRQLTIVPFFASFSVSSLSLCWLVLLWAAYSLHQHGYFVVSTAFCVPSYWKIKACSLCPNWTKCLFTGFYASACTRSVLSLKVISCLWSESSF